MNSIPTDQNEQRQLERLSAQRELYSAAKRGYCIQIVGNVLIPITLAIVSFFQIKIAIVTALFGTIFFVMDLIFITPNIAKKKSKAAKIQELFDCDVLKITKSPLKSADDISVEEVLTYYEAHSKIQSNVERVRDWYATEVGNVNIALARLICQRANCWWDKKMRNDYINTLRTISIFIPILLIVFAAIINMRLVDLVLVLSGLLPLFRFANKEYSDHTSATDRLNKTLTFIDKIWSRVLDHSYDKSKLDIDARMIQDEIYEHRTKSPLILDKLYWYFRPKSETMMVNTAAIFVKQIEDSKADF
jgi:hypothetical protein